MQEESQTGGDSIFASSECNNQLWEVATSFMLLSDIIFALFKVMVFFASPTASSLLIIYAYIHPKMGVVLSHSILGLVNYGYFETFVGFYNLSSNWK